MNQIACRRLSVLNSHIRGCIELRQHRSEHLNLTRHYGLVLISSWRSVLAGLVKRRAPCAYRALQGAVLSIGRADDGFSLRPIAPSLDGGQSGSGLMEAVRTMQVSARRFEMRGNDATGYCDGLSPDAMRASLQEPPTAAEQTRMTTTVAKRIAQACPSIVRDDCAAGAQGDRIARVILRLPYGVQNRFAKCLPSWRFSRANQAPARSRVCSSTYIIGLLPNCAESKQRVLFRHNYAVGVQGPDERSVLDDVRRDESGARQMPDLHPNLIEEHDHSDMPGQLHQTQHANKDSN